MKSLIRFFLPFLQILLLVAVWLLADQCARRSGLPIPAAVIGLAVITALLLCGLMSERYIASGALWLLAEMPLFFIPPLLSIGQFGAVFASHGLGLLGAVMVGGIIVMAGTGLVVDRVFRFENRLHERAAAKQGAQA